MSLVKNKELSASATVLNSVMPRLWPRGEHLEPILALEVIYGPYKGTVFAFTKFELFPDRKSDDGLVATKFETTIYVRPEGFTEDEAWDAYTAEVVLAWLGYLATNDYKKILMMPAEGIH